MSQNPWDQLHHILDTRCTPEYRVHILALIRAQRKHGLTPKRFRIDDEGVVTIEFQTVE